MIGNLVRELVGLAGSPRLHLNAGCGGLVGCLGASHLLSGRPCPVVRGLSQRNTSPIQLIGDASLRPGWFVQRVTAMKSKLSAALVAFMHYRCNNVGACAGTSRLYLSGPNYF